MSLYRQTAGSRPRTLIAALLAGLALGGLAGYLIGHGSVEDRSAAEAIASARADLRPVAAGLELVPIEYAGALRDGRVAARTEHEAAIGAAARAQAALDALAEDMRAIDPDGYAAATRAVADLSAAIEAVAPQSRVEALARAAAERVEVLAGG